MSILFEGITLLQNKIGHNEIKIGSQAGKENQGNYSIAVGCGAGNQSQQSYSVAIGYNAGKHNQDKYSLAIGGGAGYESQGKRAIAVGGYAGVIEQSKRTIAVGYCSGAVGQEKQSIAIGCYAGINRQPEQSIAIGYLAGSHVLITGYNEEYDYIRTDWLNHGDEYKGHNIAIGTYAGTTNQGLNSVAIGQKSAHLNQGDNSIAIGCMAGVNNQKYYSVAIGYLAGAHVNVTYVDEERIINYDDENELYKGYNIAIGTYAGLTNQGDSSISIGYGAGKINQSDYSIAIGLYAGENNQGNNSIAIGYAAGKENLLSNSIVLNASGEEFSPIEEGVYINPMTSTDNIEDNTLVYNPTTKKLSYNTTKTFVIDHPLDESKYLVHACLEGPEAGVYYRGTGEITNNENVNINLPEYASAIAKNFTVNVTKIYSGKENTGNLEVSCVESNQFTVFGKNSKFYWTVIGERQPVDVSVDKKTHTLNNFGPYTYLDNMAL